MTTQNDLTQSAQDNENQDMTDLTKAQLDAEPGTDDTNKSVADNGVNEDTLDDKANEDGVLMQLDYAAASYVTDVANLDAKMTDMVETLESSDAAMANAKAAEPTQHVALFAQLNRQEVRFHGRVTSPLLFRDTLLALFDVVSSDYRYVPKDRSAYTLFMQMRRANANKNLFSAQRDYFEWLFHNDPLAFCILDPIIQVHPNGVSFEVFSRDEGCYAQLTLDHSLFESTEPAEFGTTSIDYSAALYQGIEQIRDYRETMLDIGQQAVSLQTQVPLTHKSKQDETLNADLAADIAHSTDYVDERPIIEKRINVPKSWIRALLQVQSAAQLTQDTIHLDPIALYNVLFELRMHADIKGKRRGLLIELRPEQLPTIILEPFNIAVTSQVTSQASRARPYQGKQAKLIRLWGRRRLGLLKRLLPHTDSVSVTLLGQGMPSYWTLRGKGFVFTFAMTGFSQANWSQSLNFDLLLPARPQQHVLSESVSSSSKNKDIFISDEHQRIQALIEQLMIKPATLKGLAEALSSKQAPLTTAQIRQDILSAMQQGLVRYDSSNQLYYYRPLTQTPLDMGKLAYHNQAEKQAYDLVGRADAIKKFSVATIPTQGVMISADIHVSEDRRSYHSQLLIGEEGLVSRAECSCPQFLQHRLSQGVCAHLIALRLAYNNYDSSQDNTVHQHETCVLSKRLNRASKGRTSQSKYQASLQGQKSTAQTAISADISPANPAVLDLSALARQSEVSSPSSSSDATPVDLAHAQSLSSRSAQMAYIYLTLAGKKLQIEKVTDDKSTRQHWLYNQPEQARAAYLQQIARFEAKGFIENQGV
ncbi:MAG: hypothetical protein Q4P13_00325 [Psychrobacter sp.]|nr:hypothetical protein [Psychrobacter sp.]